MCLVAVQRANVLAQCDDGIGEMSTAVEQESRTGRAWSDLDWQFARHIQWPSSEQQFGECASARLGIGRSPKHRRVSPLCHLSRGIVNCRTMQPATSFEQWAIATTTTTGCFFSRSLLSWRWDRNGLRLWSERSNLSRGESVRRATHPH